MFKSARKEIVIEASKSHYDSLYQAIETLVENEEDIDLSLTIKVKDVSVDLNISESLIVINTLAVKRASLRGGVWSGVGKRVEKCLITTLCHLFEVPLPYFDQSSLPDSMREVDFYLHTNNTFYRCEVKLMGKGNPESADAIFARDSHIFVADTLSDLNKKQSEQFGVHWVELRSKNGYMKFADILAGYNIPHTPTIHHLSEKLDSILDKTID